MHQYFGNPMLSRFARLFFRVPVGDVYCGLRGLRRSTIDRLELQSSGMEFALEMVVKASLLKMQMSEVPTTLSADGRGRPPHLNTWRDGRRSLLLYFSSMPSGLLLYPGAAPDGARPDRRLHPGHDADRDFPVFTSTYIRCSTAARPCYWAFS